MQMMECIIYRYGCGITWHDLPDALGLWQTVWFWHARMAREGSWDVVQDRLHELAVARGLIDWPVSMDPTIARAHQHATNVTRLAMNLINHQTRNHRK